MKEETNRKPLTLKQNNVLDFIKKFMATHNYPPSIREIGDGLGLSSPATVHTHLRKLANAGCIKINANKFRAMELLVENEYVKKNEAIIKVPLLNKTLSTSAIEALENPKEFFFLPTSIIPNKKNVFILNACDNSMINAGIFNNDKVIVERQNIANNGDIVVAMINKNEVTLKRYFKEIDHIRLQPENETMTPIILKKVTILGKAIGLYHKF